MANIADRLRARFSRKSNVPGADLVVSSTEASMPYNAPLTYDYMVKSAVTANSLVFAAADYWARSLAEAPLCKFNEDGSVDKTHPITVRFATPNPFYSQDELWKSIVYELAASEKGAFMLAPLTNAGEALTLWPKSSDEVRLQPSRDTFIDHFEARTDSWNWRRLDPKEVATVWFRLIDPRNKWGSFPPVLAARREIRTLGNIGRWLDYSLQNMGKLSALIGIDAPNLDQGVANQIRDYLNENMAGANNALKFSVAAGKVTSIPVGEKFSDIDFGPLHDRMEVAVARAFGIAPELLHILASTNAGAGLGGERQTELKRQSYDDTIIPMGKMLAAKVASVFGPLYDVDPELIRFDWSTVQALDEDKDKAATRAQKCVAFAKTDELRAMMGWPALENGKGNTVPSLEQAAAFAARITSPPAVPVKMQAKAAPLAGELLRKVVDASAVSHEPAFAAACKALFAVERKRCEDVLANAKASGMALEAKWDPSSVAKMLEDAIKVDDWKSAGGIAQTIQKAMGGGAKVHELGLGMSFDLTNPKVLSAVQTRVTKLAGEVTATTKQAIRDAIAANRDSGSTMKDLADAIGSVFDAADSTRAATIARTETIGAANQGGYELAGQAIDMGLPVTKSWISMEDERTRPSHLMDMLDPIALDETFPNGLLYPGDPAGDAEEVVNCRCTCGYTAGDGTTDVSATDAEA